MIDERAALSIFKQLGALRENDHFVYASGYHGSTYVAKEMLYVYPEITWILCEEMKNLCGKGWEIDCVVGPEKGGMILSQWVGYLLAQSTGRQVTSVFAHKLVPPMGGNGFTFMQEYGNFIDGKNIFIVEDIINTGGTVKNIVSLVCDWGGIVKAVGALWNRGNMTLQDMRLAPKSFALVNKSFPRWSEAECPLCAAHFPINTQFGRGKEFLARQTVQTPHQGSTF